MMGMGAGVGQNLVVVKIGGSAITDKNGVEALKQKELGRSHSCAHLHPPFPHVHVLVHTA